MFFSGCWNLFFFNHKNVLSTLEFDLGITHCNKKTPVALSKKINADEWTDSKSSSDVCVHLEIWNDGTRALALTVVLSMWAYSTASNVGYSSISTPKKSRQSFTTTSFLFSFSLFVCMSLSVCLFGALSMSDCLSISPCLYHALRNTHSLTIKTFR